MTYLAIFLAALAFSIVLGKLLKRNLEINYPRVDDEGEVEDFLPLVSNSSFRPRQRDYEPTHWRHTSQ